MRDSQTIPGVDRAGIALATALGGLVIIGVLIAGVFFTSNQELRTGTNTFVQERAFRAAEFGLNAALASWDRAAMATLPFGASRTIVFDSSAKGWTDSVIVTRLNATTFLMLSTARAFGGVQGQARRRTALLVRLSTPDIDVPGAVTTKGPTTIGGSAVISGFDRNPSGWTSCPVAVDSVAAVATADTTAIKLSACTGALCLSGTSRMLQTPAAADTATYFEYGDEDYKSLSLYAEKVYEGSQTLSQLGPVVVNGLCDRSSTKNWGSPTRSLPAGPCESYFPIIWSKGAGSTLRLNGPGTGQGVLLVDGDLELAGGFSFYGPVIVRGRIKSSGSAQIYGAMMAANSNAAENMVLGDFTAQYSRCAVETAFRGAIPPKRVTQRAWTEVF